MLTVFEVAEWPYTFTPIATALAALVTQLYLGFRYDTCLPTRSQAKYERRRIWRLTSSKILYSVVILLAIPSFILGMACSIEAWIIKVYVLGLLCHIRLIPI